MRYQIYKDRRGEWRWRIIARNGKIVADSGEGYKRKTNAYAAYYRLEDAFCEARIKEDGWTPSTF